jgi:serine/threonine protein kinase
VGQAPRGGLLGRGSTVGRFVVLDLLGQGAFGSVYAAFDPNLERKLALKVLNAWSASEAERLELVAREARGLAKLNHPNVVGVYDVGLTGGAAWVAMEFIAGHTLTHWLEAPRPVAAVLAAFTEAGRGLAAVHAAGLVHGDFRTDNVLVGDDGRVRVSDFGLAALSHQDLPARASDDQHAFARQLERALERALGSPPRAVRQALARALSDTPWPSMNALLAALTPRPRWPWALGAALLGALGLAVALREPPCGPDLDALDTVWSPQLRAPLQRRFDQAGQPWAHDTGALVTTALDGWRTAWLESSTQACLARRAHSPPLEVELRTACLRDARREVTTLLSALEAPEPALVGRAQLAVLQLSNPAQCSEVALLRAEPSPEEPDRRHEMLRLREELAAARTLRDLGQLKAARQALDEVHTLAADAGFPVLDARASFELGATQSRQGEHEAAAERIERALSTALEHRADDLAAHAAVLLVYERGVALHQESRAQELTVLARALVARIGDDRLAAGLLVNEALLAESAGRRDDAIDMQRAAVERFERAARGSPAQANARLNLSRLLVMAGQTSAALAEADAARTLLIATRGPAHPNVGVAWLVSCEAELDEGRIEEAWRACGQARDIARDALGASHPETAEASEALARVALARGDAVQARALAEAAAQSATCEHLEWWLTLAQAQLASREPPHALEQFDACHPTTLEPATKARRALLEALALPPGAAREHLVQQALAMPRINSQVARQLRALLPSSGRAAPAGLQPGR